MCIIVDQNHKNGGVSMMEEEAVDAAWIHTVPRPRTESTIEGTKSLSIYLCSFICPLCCGKAPSSHYYYQCVCYNNFIVGEE